MANWKSFGDRMLYCHQSMLKTRFNPARIHNFSTTTTRVGGDLLFPRITGCTSCSSPPVRPPRSLSSSPLLRLPPGMVVVVDDHKYSIKYSNNDNKNSSSNDDYFHFFSLSEGRQFRVRKYLSIPWQRDLLTPDTEPCGGSSDGWLAFTDDRNGHPYLYNPLMESPEYFPYIPLPSLETLDFFCGVRQLKPSPLSPSSSPSLLTQFLIAPAYFKNYNVRVDTYEHVSIEDNLSYFYLTNFVTSSAPSPPFYSASSSSSSSSSLGNDCTIMAMHSVSSAIVFCKPGDDRWTALGSCNFIDLIYFSKDERFYALSTSYHSMEAWDLKDPSCPKKQVFDRPHFCRGKLQDKFGGSDTCEVKDYHCLVESCGDLLLLCRLEEKVVNNNKDDERENYAYRTLGFDVHKFDFDHNRWEPVECLGDRVLFVGLNSSISLSTRDYPKLMRNSIYFMDDLHGRDNGIFHLKDGCIKLFTQED